MRENFLGGCIKFFLRFFLKSLDEKTEWNAKKEAEHFWILSVIAVNISYSNHVTVKFREVGYTLDFSCRHVSS